MIGRGKSDERRIEATALMLAGKRTYNEKGCWIWQGRVGGNGYGFVIVRRGVTQYRFSVHRLSFAYYERPLKFGELVRHMCDIRRCFNPEHLLPGTSKQNSKDMAARGRCYWQTPAGKQRRRQLTEEGKNQRAYETMHEQLYQKRYGYPVRPK